MDSVTRQGPADLIVDKHRRSVEFVDRNLGQRGLHRDCPDNPDCSILLL